MRRVGQTLGSSLTPKTIYSDEGECLLIPIERQKHPEQTNEIEWTLSDRLLPQAQPTFARSSHYFLPAAQRVQANNCDSTNRTRKEMLLKKRSPGGSVLIWPRGTERGSATRSGFT